MSQRIQCPICRSTEQIAYYDSYHHYYTNPKMEYVCDCCGCYFRAQLKVEVYKVISERPPHYIDEVAQGGG